MSIQKFLSVNFHFTTECNMKCKYCFARKKSSNVTEEETLTICKKVCDYLSKQDQATKITFVGGEPLLHKELLVKLIKIAKEYHIETMIVTNGSLLTEEFLQSVEGSLDWIGLSIDSLNAETNQRIGRCFNDKTHDPLDEKFYLQKIEMIKNYGYKLKINTVVSKYNKNEDLTDFLKKVEPQKYKVFQVLRIDGINGKNFKEFEVTKEEFNNFDDRHKEIKHRIIEDNGTMQGSYLMIDEKGRFFDNVNHQNHYSESILKVEVKQAINSICFDEKKSMSRQEEKVMR